MKRMFKRMVKKMARGVRRKKGVLGVCLGLVLGLGVWLGLGGGGDMEERGRRIKELEFQKRGILERMGGGNFDEGLKEELSKKVWLIREELSELYELEGDDYLYGGWEVEDRGVDLRDWKRVIQERIGLRLEALRNYQLASIAMGDESSYIYRVREEAVGVDPVPLRMMGGDMVMDKGVVERLMGDGGYRRKYHEERVRSSIHYKKGKIYRELVDLERRLDTGKSVEDLGNMLRESEKEFWIVLVSDRGYRLAKYGLGELYLYRYQNLDQDLRDLWKGKEILEEAIRLGYWSDFRGLIGLEKVYRLLSVHNEEELRWIGGGGGLEYLKKAEEVLEELEGQRS